MFRKGRLEIAGACQVCGDCGERLCYNHNTPAEAFDKVSLETKRSIMAILIVQRVIRNFLCRFKIMGFSLLLQKESSTAENGEEQ